MFVATLTGSFVYTNSDTQWVRLHETDGIHRYEPDPAAKDAVQHIGNLGIEVPTFASNHLVEPSGAARTRARLREVALALRAGVTHDLSMLSNAKDEFLPAQDGLLAYRLRASVPLNGFPRTDVSRLVLTFGRIYDVAPVRLAVFLAPFSQTS